MTDNAYPPSPIPADVVGRARAPHLWAGLVAVVGALVMLAACQTTAQAAPAVPQQVTGLVKTHAVSPTDTQSPKTSIAVCPAGKQIVGGGGWAFELNDPGRGVTLVRLQPTTTHLVNGQHRHAYVVTGAEATQGVGNWWVEAYALCANPLSGHHIVVASTPPSSATVQATAAVCPSGERVLGSGAFLYSANYNPTEVRLQVARPSLAGDIARAQGHEDPTGYAGSWFVYAYAICAPAPLGYEVVFAASPERLSESEKGADASCPGGKQLLSAGAAISTLAPGHVSLQVIYPYNDLESMQAWAVENDPTTLNWDSIVGSAVCAN